MNLTPHHILIFGAGKSATVLISYLLSRSEKNKWQITVVDADIQLAQSKIKHHPHATALSFDIRNSEERQKTIQEADIVISMLPPDLHYLIACDCLAHRKNLLTASYLDEKIKGLEKDIRQQGLTFLCEMGLDPGIDHMSAMQLIDNIHNKGGSIKSFRSHCGGLIAPESDDNPWHYKVTWNPANIVNAGRTGAIFKRNGQIFNIGHGDLFNNCDTVHIPGLGPYAFYPNRDSLSYANLYGLESADTFMRTTLRHPDFCKGWHHIINAGLTESAMLQDFTGTSCKAWLEYSLKKFAQTNNLSEFVEEKVSKEDQQLITNLFTFLGVTSQAPLHPSAGNSSASILQALLEKKLKLKSGDTDMIVMLHEIDYELDKEIRSTKSSMIVKGENELHTAMAKTVGLPLAIATELILNHTITITGLHIPLSKPIYEPVLMKLKESQIRFEEM